MKHLLPLVFTLTISLNLFAQTMQIEQVILSTGWKKNLTEGQTVHFPTAATLNPSLSFVIQNTGAATLEINSFYLDGDNTTHFTLSGFASLTLAPGEQTDFAVDYNPPAQFTTESSAGLVFTTNSIGSPTYVLNLSGPGRGLYGPTYPTFGVLTAEFFNNCPQTNNCIGRATGSLATFSVIEQANRTDTYRGTVVSPTGDVWIRTSLNDGSFSGTENFTFSPSESDLASGVLVHRGVSTVNTVSGGDVTVYLKYTETLTRSDGVTPFPLTDPASLGLSEELGGLAKFANSTDVLNAHSIITASFNYDGPFEPFLDFNEAIPDKTCNNCAFYSINKGFYWENLAPQLQANNPLLIEPGETLPITTDFLNAHDDEELPANPENVVFDFNSVNPLPFNSGVLSLNGIPLTGSDSFTLADLQNGLLTYQNTNLEVPQDAFQFRVSDSKGKFAEDAGTTIYNFNITIDVDISINDLSNPLGIRSFRASFNPMTNEATVQFSTLQSSKTSISLYALDGSKAASVFEGQVVAATHYSLPFNVHHLPTGIYVLVLQSDKGDFQRVKLAVTR